MITLLAAVFAVAVLLTTYRYFAQATVIRHPAQFDGRRDVVEVPDAPMLDLDDTFTIEVRLRIPRRQTSRQHTSCIVGKGKGVNNTDHNYYLGVLNRNNKLYFHIGDSAGGYQQIVATKPLLPDQWMRVAAVRDSNRLALYINGELNSETTRTIRQVANDAPLRLGATEGTLSIHYLSGEIDEVRIWNVARSKGQLKRSLEHEVSPFTPGLVFVSKRSDTP